MTVERYFVDRDEELRIFRCMVAGEEPKRVLDICAGPGTGKSWLLRRMGHDCDEAALLPGSSGASGMQTSSTAGRSAGR